MEEWANRKPLSLVDPPPISGCYAFFESTGRRCLYVGSAVNIRKRIQMHSHTFNEREAGCRFDSMLAVYIHSDARYRCHLETMLIGLLNPCMNVKRRASLGSRCA